MPYFLVYDPPDQNGPYLIRQRKKGPQELKEFSRLWMAEQRMREIGTAIRQLTTIHFFHSHAVAQSWCAEQRELRMKKPAEAGSSPSEEAQSAGLPEPLIDESIEAWVPTTGWPWPLPVSLPVSPVDGAEPD